MIIPFYSWSWDKKGKTLEGCAFAAAVACACCTRQHSHTLSSLAASKMSENLTRWKAERIQWLRGNMKQVEMGMVFVVQLWEIVYKTDLRNLSEGFFFVCLRHLSWEHQMNNAFTSTSTVHFLDFFWKNFTWKGKKYKTKPNRCGQRMSSFLELGDFPVENWVRSFSLSCVMCEEQNWFSTVQFQSSGEMFVTHMCAWHIEITRQCRILSQLLKS